MPPAPPIPTGKVKTFGAYGPKYVVGQPLRPLSDGDWMISVLLPETGEQTEYRLTHISADPEAA